MKSFLKFTALLALVVGGRLSRTSQPALVASQPPVPAATHAVLVNQRSAQAPVPAGQPQQHQTAQAQVLSVFFK